MKTNTAQPIDIAAIRDEFDKAWTAAALENYCGFDTGYAGSAVVTITPKHRGNTRLGKEERAVLVALGASAPTKRGGDYWMSASRGACEISSQSGDVWEAAASAAAKVLRAHGFDAHMHSWGD